jgi:hypothetical protein
MTKMTMTVPTLPAAFSDLQPFVATWWPHETQQQRYIQRQTSRMEDLQLFYDLLAPRINEALDHLDQFPVDQPLPPAEEALYRLTLGLSEVAAAVEVYHQPEVPNVPIPHIVHMAWSDGTKA